MSGKVSTILDFGATDIVDMPVIRTNSGTTFLFYRFYDSGATRHKIRAGTLTYNGTSFGGGITGSVGSSTHKDVQTTGGGDISETPATMANVDVDFYNVSPQLDVIFYGTVNEAFYRNFNTAGGIDNAWSTTTESFFVDGHVGNPSGIGAGNNLTDRHALRSTVEWVP
jgi:hypothetical protein